MEMEERHRPHRQILWGLFLMALGGLFLLDRTGLVELPSIGRFWPAVLLVIGASKFLARRWGSGAMLSLMGLAFFAAEFGWAGLAYHNFWPLLLVAVGVGIVIKALSREDERFPGEESPMLVGIAHAGRRDRHAREEASHE
jgi:hypothetical protein